MRVNLKGIASATKKLADGTERRYLYAWRGGPLLRDSKGQPISNRDHPELAYAYAEAQKTRIVKPDDNLAALISEFRETAEFRKRKDKTRAEYERYLKLIEERFGSMPLVVVQDKRVRRDFKAFRDEYADRPRTADYIWGTLARVLSVAKDNGRIGVNVCERGGRLYEADRRESLWEAADIAAFIKVASLPLQQALLAALWTGQRQGDLLAMKWSQYDGSSIRVRQGKTGAGVRIPAGGPLLSILDDMPRIDDVILTNSRGKPWTSDGFKTSWGKATKKAGITGLTFHDLRGTAVTRLAKAGCSVSEIAAITGHSLKDAAAILDSHYLGGQFELAESAIRKLELQTGLQTGEETDNYEPAK